MRWITTLTMLVVLSALPAGPMARFAQSGPTPPTANQCVMIPEVMKGQKAIENPAVPYEPEFCVAWNFGNHGNDKRA